MLNFFASAECYQGRTYKKIIVWKDLHKIIKVWPALQTLQLPKQIA